MLKNVTRSCNVYTRVSDPREHGDGEGYKMQGIWRRHKLLVSSQCRSRRRDALISFGLVTALIVKKSALDCL